MKDYSQHGEQAILEKLLPEYGVLIDIGAFDGERNSNTRMPLERGWRGVMIEPNLRAMTALMRNTAHLNCSYLPISVDGKSRIEELVCSATDFNGLSSIAGQTPPGETIRQSTLAMTPEQVCDLLCVTPTFVSIDAEGCDESILMNWPDERLPLVFVYEHDKMKNEGTVHDRLRQWKYKEVARTAGNSIWRREALLDRWKRTVWYDACLKLSDAAPDRRRA
jgi:hypothetical protein